MRYSERIVELIDMLIRSRVEYSGRVEDEAIIDSLKNELVCRFDDDEEELGYEDTQDDIALGW